MFLMSMKKCPRCGYENPDDAQFCMRCHYPLFEIPATNIVKEEEVKVKRLTERESEYLLAGSVLGLASITFLFLPPNLVIYFAIINILSNINYFLLSFRIKKYYSLIFLQSLGMIFLYFEQLEYYGVLLFSFGGLIVSFIFNELYLMTRNDMFRIASLFMVIGYLGGLLFPLIFSLSEVGYVILLLESVNMIRKREMGKK